MTSQVTNNNASFVSINNSDLYEKQVKHFCNDVYDEFKGEGRESHFSWLLSCFKEIGVIKCKRGSLLDLRGVDILLELEKDNYLQFQVKSSEFSAKKFLEKPNKYSKDIIVVWYDTLCPKSKKQLFLLTIPLLKKYGVELKSEYEQAYSVYFKLKEIPKRVLSKNQYEFLERNGLISYSPHKGTFVCH